MDAGGRVDAIPEKERVGRCTNGPASGESDVVAGVAAIGHVRQPECRRIGDPLLKQGKDVEPFDIMSIVERG